MREGERERERERERDSKFPVFLNVFGYSVGKVTDKKEWACVILGASSKENSIPPLGVTFAAPEEIDNA